jgi:hypothetical protein
MSIEQLLLANLYVVAPSSLLGEALHYLHGQWPKLTRFLESGTWALDSNPVENAIRPFVVGRKGWLLADTVGGANASANLYSLIETAKANGIEPYRYFVALFKKLPLAQTADDYVAPIAPQESKASSFPQRAGGSLCSTGRPGVHWARMSAQDPVGKRSYCAGPQSQGDGVLRVRQWKTAQSPDLPRSSILSASLGE